MNTPTQTQPRILIIEDEKGIVLAIDTWLKRHTKTLASIVVDHAPDLQSGRNRAKEAHLIILDLSLPDSPDPETTLGFVPELRCHAPVIVLTGREESAFPPDRALTILGIEQGADQVLFKSMIHTAEGMDWLMLCIQGALLRRAHLIKNPWKLAFPKPTA